VLEVLFVPLCWHLQYQALKEEQEVWVAFGIVYCNIVEFIGVTHRISDGACYSTSSNNNISIYVYFATKRFSCSCRKDSSLAGAEL
jgi:hypothetical protein